MGVKISEFLLRDYWYRRLAGEITRGARGDEAKLEALLGWTRDHIRRIPAGWPVMDDHILYIIVRGCGEEDQVADVFTCLSSYSGIPAFWGVVKPGPGSKAEERLVLSFALVQGRWTVWDVARGIVFRRKDGSPASVSELATDREFGSLNVSRLNHQGRPYAEYLSKGLPHFFAPVFSRAQKQMPLPRVFFEAKRFCFRLWNGWSRWQEEAFDPKIIFGN